MRDEGEKKREREGDVWKEVEQKRSKRKAADEYVPPFPHGALVSNYYKCFADGLSTNRDLRTTLSTLSTLSTNVTRHLDYTYYSLLSSLSSLTSTIQELHNLSNSTTELSTRFKDESISLSDDTTNQIQNTTINFDAQARRIQDLENRIKVGRTEATNLSLRLNAVRTKVESSARRDTEDERRIGRRLKVLWGFLGFWIVLLMILIIVRQRAHGMDVKGGKLVELGNRTWDEKMGSREVHKAWGWESKGNRSEDNGRSSSGERVGASSSRTRSSSKRSSAVDAEATLRLFDEL